MHNVPLKIQGKSILNQYIFLQKLGEGTSGTVKLVVNSNNQQKYAVKILNKNVLKKRREILRGPDGSN